jgi:diguanylate cyclase (GGDEF)-like protein/PAS domain S-box-containing protein
MPFMQRALIFCGIAVALLGYWSAPHWLGLDLSEVNALTIGAPLLGPLAAAVFSLIAARRSSGSDRVAWTCFTAGSALYFGGNLWYLALAISGTTIAFPAAPEVAYFVMAACFLVGVFQYSGVHRKMSRGYVLNFTLIYCATTLGSLFVLSPNLAASSLTPFGTIVAFLYPALWYSVGASGLIALLLFNQGARTFPFVLILLAVLAESGADYIYVVDLMEGTYQPGGVTQLLWLASAAMIAWAAAEQMVIAGRITPNDTMRRRTGRAVVQAGVPAVAIGSILITGSLSGALGDGLFLWLSLTLAATFALVAGVREHWIIHTQRRLRSTIEDSRTELARSQTQLRSVLESTTDGVLAVDRDWKLVFFNQQAVKTTRKSEMLRIGASLWDMYPNMATSGEGERYRRAMKTQRPEDFEIYIEDRDFWLSVQAYPTPEGLSIFFRDISEQRRAREELSYQAHHDTLTGLANRLLFRERLQDALQGGGEVATFLLDLDHFKEVNDTLGHAVGDKLLQATAQRLSNALGPDHTLARLGGDEFAVIVSNYGGRSDLVRLAKRILSIADRPYDIDGNQVIVGASIGIALCADCDGNPEKMFRNADIALYAAKGESRGGYCFFEPAMEVALQQRQSLRTALGNALQNGEFALAYQPLVDLKSDRICGFEALLRWQHPTLGRIAPDVFIPLAEETGLIVGIGDWVLKTACTEAMNWPASVSVAVNLSARQFSSGGLVEQVEAALATSGLPSTRLELEITETVLLRDTKANMATLQRFRENAIRIALDDFGTGYSSLGYLQRFPFSKIKIDRSFISGLSGNDESHAIVRSVISLGRALGLRVTAEGVETEAQYAWVKAGCDEAQGYLLSPPVPAADVAGLIERFGAVRGSSTADTRRLAS